MDYNCTTPNSVYSSLSGSSEKQFPGRGTQFVQIDDDLQSVEGISEQIRQMSSPSAGSHQSREEDNPYWNLPPEQQWNPRTQNLNYINNDYQSLHNQQKFDNIRYHNNRPVARNLFGVPHVDESSPDSHNSMDMMQFGPRLQGHVNDVRHPSASEIQMCANVRLQVFQEAMPDSPIPLQPQVNDSPLFGDSMHHLKHHFGPYTPLASDMCEGNMNTFGMQPFLTPPDEFDHFTIAGTRPEFNGFDCFTLAGTTGTNGKKLSPITTPNTRRERRYHGRFENSWDKEMNSNHTFTSPPHTPPASRPVPEFIPRYEKPMFGPQQLESMAVHVHKQKTPHYFKKTTGNFILKNKPTVNGIRMDLIDNREISEAEHPNATPKNEIVSRSSPTENSIQHDFHERKPNARKKNRENLAPCGLCLSTGNVSHPISMPCPTKQNISPCKICGEDGDNNHTQTHCPKQMKISLSLREPQRVFTERRNFHKNSRFNSKF